MKKQKLTSAEYMEAIAKEEYPTDPIVPLAHQFKDERGTILNLIFSDIKSVALISSHKGTERSNHYHKTDSHFLFVLFGEMEYYERNLEDPFDDTHIIVKQGQMVFTPPLKVHKTVFTKDTLLLSCSKQTRTYELHKEDMVKENY